MWPFKKIIHQYKASNLVSVKFRELEERITTIAEELAKHLSNHDLQKDIHANCVSQEKVNDIICQLKRKN